MRLLLAAVLATVALLAGACNNCVREKCAYPALLLTVRDATTATPLPQATVSQGGMALSPQPNYCVSGQCTHAISPPASGLLTVSQFDYAQASVNFVPRADDCGNVMRQAVDVDLVPTGSSDPSEVSAARELGAGCNGS